MLQKVARLANTILLLLSLLPIWGVVVGLGTSDGNGKNTATTPRTTLSCYPKFLLIQCTATDGKWCASSKNAQVAKVW